MVSAAYTGASQIPDTIIDLDMIDESYDPRNLFGMRLRAKNG